MLTQRLDDTSTAPLGALHHQHRQDRGRARADLRTAFGPVLGQCGAPVENAGPDVEQPLRPVQRQDPDAHRAARPHLGRYLGTVHRQHPDDGRADRQDRLRDDRQLRRDRRARHPPGERGQPDHGAAAGEGLLRGHLAARHGRHLHAGPHRADGGGLGQRFDMSTSMLERVIERAHRQARRHRPALRQILDTASSAILADLGKATRQPSPKASARPRCRSPAASTQDTGLLADRVEQREPRARAGVGQHRAQARRCQPQVRQARRDGQCLPRRAAGHRGRRHGRAPRDRLDRPHRQAGDSPRTRVSERLDDATLLVERSVDKFNSEMERVLSNRTRGARSADRGCRQARRRDRRRDGELHEPDRGFARRLRGQGQGNQPHHRRAVGARQPQPRGGDREARGSPRRPDHPGRPRAARPARARHGGDERDALLHRHATSSRPRRTCASPPSRW